jgi:hypothetical protein
MPPQTPYSHVLGTREPMTTIRETIAGVAALTASWSVDDLERTYAPGKWSARQIVTHLAQAEIALGTRARMTLVTPGYAAPGFEQDAWMAREAGLGALVAREAFLALARMNLALFASLSAADRQTPLSHPQYGALTVDWVVHQMAGHQLHHFRQLEQIAQG